MSDTMLTLQGLGASRGYAIGRAVVLGAAALEVSHYRIEPDHIEDECARLSSALTSASAEFRRLAEALPEDTPREVTALLQVHAMLLDDPMLARDSLALIRERHYNAEWALTAQGQILAEQFAAMSDDYLRERAGDVRQVIERVLQVLAGAPDLAATARVNVDADAMDALVVVAHDISPADMIKLRGGRFAAFVTDLGAATSHTAIVARSLGVPAVVALGNVRTLTRDGDLLIVDGETGAIVINPTEQVLQEYQRRQAAFLAERAQLSQLKDTPAITLDGIRISLQANIEWPEEAHAALAAGAEGIGLLRSEFLFMNRATLPDEEEQYQAYSQAVRIMAGRPVTLRTLDIGADKTLDGEATVATNPALGERAIRYCLARPEMFGTQLRAILRAAAHGRVKVMFPMIATMQEVVACRQALDAARAVLDARGDTYGPVEVGAMVEIPATAIAIEPFAESLDFLSIGTNDLIQYTLAIDRADPDVARLYDPLHPAVLRLIANTINAGARFGKPVSVCGEMAGDLVVTRLLLGLGLTGFSMHPQQLLDVKREVLNAHTNALRTRVAASLNRAERIDLSAL